MEALLLYRNDLIYIVALCVKLGISAVVLRDRYLKDLGKELTVDPEQLPVARGSAKDPSKDVSPSLVRGNDS